VNAQLIRRAARGQRYDLKVSNRDRAGEASLTINHRRDNGPCEAVTDVLPQEGHQTAAVLEDLDFQTPSGMGGTASSTWLMKLRKGLSHELAKEGSRKPCATRSRR